MRGIETVAVLTRTATETDEMGEPVYEWTSELVDGVLVLPLTGSDLTDEMRPDGVRVAYKLAMPRTWTATLTSLTALQGARIALVERGMDAGAPEDALRVSGSPDVTNTSATRWNMLVEVGRVDG